MGLSAQYILSRALMRPLLEPICEQPRRWAVLQKRHLHDAFAYDMRRCDVLRHQQQHGRSSRLMTVQVVLEWPQTAPRSSEAPRSPCVFRVYLVSIDTIYLS